MRPRTATALAAATLALLAVQAAPAAGSPLPFALPSWVPAQLRAQVRSHTDPRPRRAAHSFTTVVRLGAPGGYQVAVSGSQGTVALVAGRKRSLSATEYVTRGVVKRNRIAADLGGFGAVSMRFRPAGGRGADPRPVCLFHRLVVARHGVFVGRLRFEGEDGYVSLRRHRAKGEVTSIGRRCKGGSGLFGVSGASTHSSGSRDGGPEPKILVAGWRHAVDSAGVIALDLFGEPFFLAESAHTEGRLAIMRFALARGAPRTFTLDDAITRAKLAPPAPFHGTGVYSAAPDGTRSWEGSLTVNFPGAPRFQLTGAPFEAEVEGGF